MESTGLQGVAIVAGVEMPQQHIGVYLMYHPTVITAADNVLFHSINAAGPIALYQ
jgi:hypothetical protein